MNQYEIYSESEDGWWNNDLGWVSDRRYADVFKGTERLPMSAGDDAQWVGVRESLKVAA
jgi:hypothetical protein